MQYAHCFLWLLACRYIETFQAGFDEGLKRVPVYFMQSDGGLTSVADFSGHKAILSGPAGGHLLLRSLCSDAWHVSQPP